MLGNLFGQLIGFQLTILAVTALPTFASSLEEVMDFSQASDSDDDFPIAPLSSQPIVFDHLRQENLEGVFILVDSHLKAGVPPCKIGVVFDLDGTLTAHSTPGDHPTQDRYGATDIVLKLIEMGVNVTISSAWNVFNETLNRLDDLQLTKVLNIQNRDEIDHGTYKDMNYYHLGNVAAVQSTGIDAIYFRQKAWAPYIVHGPDVMNSVEKIIFADDSLANIRFFKGDVHFNKLYPKATQFDYFLLTAINGIPKENPPLELEKEEDIPPLLQEETVNGQIFPWHHILTFGKEQLKILVNNLSYCVSKEKGSKE